MNGREQNKQIEVGKAKSNDLLSTKPYWRRGRAYRRLMKKREFDRLFRIVTRSYVPHAGYVDWSYVGDQWRPTGRYIKFPKNSKTQRWCKRISSARVRKYKGLPRKGNRYRRVFDYWWTIY